MRYSGSEIETRKWIEERVGKIKWGDLNDFLNLRKELIKKDESIEWDIGKLRKEIFKEKLKHIRPSSLRNQIVNDAFEIVAPKLLFEMSDEVNLYPTPSTTMVPSMLSVSNVNLKLPDEPAPTNVPL